MYDHVQVEFTIFVIADSHPQVKKILSKKNDMALYLILRSIYPEAEAWQRYGHVITRVGRRFYDINGPANHCGYAPFLKDYDMPYQTKEFLEVIGEEYQREDN